MTNRVSPLRDLELPGRLEGGDGDGVREVQAPRFRPDRNPNRTIRTRGQPAHRKPSAFRPEYERIAGLIMNIRVRLSCLGAKIPESVGSDGFGHFIDVVDDAEIEVLPIVEPGPTDVAIIEQEAEGADQPKGRADRHAGSADRAGVAGDFRLDQDDV